MQRAGRQGTGQEDGQARGMGRRKADRIAFDRPLP